MGYSKNFDLHYHTLSFLKVNEFERFKVLQAMSQNCKAISLLRIAERAHFFIEPVPVGLVVFLCDLSEFPHAYLIDYDSRPQHLEGLSEPCFVIVDYEVRQEVFRVFATVQENRRIAFLYFSHVVEKHLSSDFLLEHGFERRLCHDAYMP